MPHERLRSESPGLHRDNGMAAVVKAGREVFLRGQSGFTPGGDVMGVGDAGAQADQAMRNVRALLEKAGSQMEHICKVTTYVTDRAYLEPVRKAIGRHLGEIAPVGTGLLVNGLARPEMLVAIDIDAVIPGEAR